MKSWPIRRQLLFNAMLPAAAVVLVLATTFLAGRFGDLDDAHLAYGEGMARHIAATAEYSVFSGNTEALQRLAGASLRESDITAVGIFGPRGDLLAWAGAGAPPAPDAIVAARRIEQDEYGRWVRISLPIHVEERLIADPIDGLIAQSGSPDTAAASGFVLLDLSRTEILRKKALKLGAGIAVALACLGFGAVLALRISRRVSGPIEEVIEVVDRIGRGDLSARVASRTSVEALRRLEAGVNAMAANIHFTQERLQQEVEAATEALRGKKDEAEAAAQARSRFLAVASHDLRQPLHALGMFVSRLNEFDHSPKVEVLIAHVEESVEALRCLIDALLDISRLDAGALTAERSRFPVLRLLKRLNDDYAPIAADQGLLLSIRPDTRWIESDPVLLERILRNLVTNAIRYTPQGRILVGCRQRQGALRIEVWDTGPGIPPEKQEEIFREFVQLANPERDRSKGLGLGLAIVDRAARLLEHPVGLCSRPGRGSMFFVAVPLAGAGKEDSREPVSRGKLPRMRIMVVDDDALVMQGMVELLEGWGCEVLAAASGDEALAFVDQGWAPDLVLCDYRLAAGENGFEVQHRLRERLGTALPAVMATGETDPAIARRAEQLGMTVLHKPVRPARLRALLNRLAASRQPPRD